MAVFDKQQIGCTLETTPSGFTQLRLEEKRYLISVMKTAHELFVYRRYVFPKIKAAKKPAASAAKLVQISI